jgi:NADPH:quinone reductase
MTGPVPKTMTAVGFDAPGGPEVLRPETVPVPIPGEGQVVIRVAYAGVNRPDVAQRQGLYPPPPGASPLPGLEVAGEIVAVGPGVPEDHVGARVCALVSGGGYAEYCLAHIGHCLPVPRTMHLAEAAAIPETLFTVWHNVFERGWAKEGETLLVHGGTSGIGTMATMLGKASSPPAVMRRNARRRAGSARTCRSIIARPISSRRCSASPAARGSRWCSTWSRASTSRAISSAWRWTGGM